MHCRHFLLSLGQGIKAADWRPEATALDAVRSEPLDRHTDPNAQAKTLHATDIRGRTPLVLGAKSGVFALAEAEAPLPERLRDRTQNTLSGLSAIVLLPLSEKVSPNPIKLPVFVCLL